MGQSTDAQLVYGVHLEEDVVLPWDDEEDVLDWWLKKQFGFVWDYTKTYEENRAQENAYLEKSPPPFNIAYHCHHDHPMYIATPYSGEEVDWACLVANRGYPVEVSAAALREEPETLEAIRAALTEHGIKFGKSGWFLCSMWG